MWYKTGTASFTNGSASVVGVGTDWITGAAVGEAVIAPDGRIYEIGAVTSATGLTIIPAYLGSNTSGAAYTIAPTQAYIRDLATEVAELVNQYANVANGAGQGKFPDGSVTAPGIRFTADENTGLRRLSADTMALVAGGVDIVTISPSGISAASLTTALSGKLNAANPSYTGTLSGGPAQVEQANYSSPGLTISATAETSRKYQFSMVTGGNFALTDTAAAVQRFSVDTAGNFGLGVTPSAWRSTYRVIEGGRIGNALAFSTVGSAVELLSNAYINSSNQYAYANNGFASDYYQIYGAHFWYTAPSGTAGNPISFTQAMTLDTSGNLLVGTASTTPAISDGVGVAIQPGGGMSQFTGDGGPCLGLNRKANDGEVQRFYRGGTQVGSVSVTGAATAYNTSSDARLKENISDADNGSALIDQLQVRKFDWKADGSHQRYGFVAQELDTVFPEAVSKPADPDEMMGVDYSKLVPLLVQEIQALRARVAALEAA